MKAIVYSGHAIVAMRERDLEEAWVERAVREPEWTEPDPRDPDAVRHFRTVPERGNRFLRVVLVESSENIRILTAFLDRGARPK